MGWATPTSPTLVGNQREHSARRTAPIRKDARAARGPVAQYEFYQIDRKK